MKRLMTAVYLACLTGAAASAQTASTDKMAKDKMAKPMMVTGCVAAGTEGGHFMLTHGMMAGDTTGKSYDLTGDELKAHVGHKVEVTGTMDDGKMMAKDTMAKDKMAKDAMAKSMPGALHVTSVKMLASTCS